MDRGDRRGGGTGPDLDSLLQEDPDLSFGDVGGMAELLRTLDERVVDPLRHPERYAEYGLGTVGGVLLYGPPGCGKTHVAHALAGETGYNFVEVTPTDFTSKYVGQAADNVADVFELARNNRPCLLFVDEIDAVATDRSGIDNPSEQQMVNQLLAELDDVDQTGFVVLAATNYLADVDDAILRSGRFDERIEVPPPDATARYEILKVHLRDPPTGDLSLSAAAKTTAGYAASDVELVAELAARKALKENDPVENRHLRAAIEETSTSLHGWIDRYDWLAVEDGEIVERTDEEVEEGHRALEDFSDLAGMSDLKATLQERVLDPAINREAYEEYGIEGVDGALLYGPPGCGKTHLAHGMAGEVDAPLFEVSPESLFGAGNEEPIDVLESTVDTATSNQPFVLCLADVDEIAPAGGPALSGTRTRLVNRLATLLETIVGTGSLVVGTARRPDAVARKVLHAGCFDERIEVGPPNGETRRAVLLAELPDDSTADVEWERVVEATEGFAVTDLQHVAHASARRAIRAERQIRTDDLLELAGETTPSIAAGDGGPP